MKKLLMILAAVSFICLTSSKCTNSVNKPANDPGEEEADTSHTPAAVDLIVMVYSNAYDGFLNVREQPDVKSKIIGKILNGPMGAIKMGEVGGWTIVKVGDTIGYASSKYLQTEPTKEFTDKDMEKCIQGIWVCTNEGASRVLILMKNNVFADGFKVEGAHKIGEWSVKGSVLNLHYTHIRGSEWSAIDENQTFTVVNGDLLQDFEKAPYKKQSLMSKKNYDEYIKKCEGVEAPEWNKMDSEHYELLYEEAHLRVKGEIK